MAALRNRCQTRMGHTVICRGQTAARRAALDIARAGRAGAAVSANTQTHGQSAPAARALIETLHSRAQIRAERRLRNPRQ